MGPSEEAQSDQVLMLCTRGDAVLDSLRSLVQQAEQAQTAFLNDVRPLLAEADRAVEKYGIGEVVTPALKQLQEAWVGLLEREVRFFDLVSEIERVHEELFTIVTVQGKLSR